MDTEIRIPIGRFIVHDKPMNGGNPHNLNRTMVMGMIFSKDVIQEHSTEMWEAEIVLKNRKVYHTPNQNLGGADDVFTSEYMWQPDFWENDYGY